LLFRAIKCISTWGGKWGWGHEKLPSRSHFYAHNYTNKLK
jgi:hypothetical protein